MAKKWFKQKNTLPYFARIDAGSLDLSEGLIAQILVDTNEGSLQESWPNASLEDLQTFLSKLVADVVRAGSGPIQLGNIEYFERNAKGKPEETGLTWDSPIISSDFENFVVSTANDLFNNQNTRQDESIDYEQMVEALDDLQKAALTYTNLEIDDMPVYPSAEIFQQARNTGEDLPIYSKRLTPAEGHYENESLVTDQQSLDQAAEPVSEPAGKTDSPLVQDDASTVTPDMSQNRVSASKEAPQGDEQSVPEQPSTDSSAAPEPHPLEKILSRINLTVPYFELSKEPQLDVPANSPEYVSNQINLFKKESNQFLNITKETFLAKIGTALSKQAEVEQQRHEAALEKLNDSDWEKQLEKRLAEEKGSESKRLFQERQQAFKTQYDRAVTQENQRHDQALNDLQVTFQNQLDGLRPQIDAELNAWYEQRNRELHETYRSQLTTMIEETKQLQAEQLIIALSKTASELTTKFNEHFAEAQEKTTDELERRRAVAQQEHERAVRLATQSQQAANQSQSLTDLQGQIGSLSESVCKIQDERDAEHQKRLEVESRYERLNDQLINQNHQAVNATPASPATDNSAVIDIYKELLEQEKTRNASLTAQPTTKSSKGFPWKTGLVSLFMLGLAGGVGTLVISQQKLSADYQSLSKENQALKKASTQQTTASTSSSQAAGASSASSSNQSAEQSQVDRPYQALDDSLKRNSLDIYRQSFADNKLGDDSYRVFRVGQLLNQQSSRDEAVAVAKANPGYNQTLNRYLGIN
ncbi:hypothetical protein ACT5YR_06210 [Fructobacillus fructosus]|uniref:Uncharacterized protein n=1 Tax=Fructobacillus fructosus TaxID=1631 RepID=A0ABM9MZT2_9LACO|nr:hypothetical protein R54839_PPFHFPJH_01393 [Fructobacillus fructosus]